MCAFGKGEEMGRVRNGIKWKSREEERERERESEGREGKGTEREMYSLFLPPPFLHTDYDVWSLFIWFWKN